MIGPKERDQHEGETPSRSSRGLPPAAQLTGDADDDQRLGGEEGKHHSSQDGGQEDLVNSIALMCLLEHIQRERKRGQNAVEPVSIPIVIQTACEGTLDGFIMFVLCFR